MATKHTAKTVPTAIAPETLISSVENPKRRRDAEYLLALFRELTGMEPRVWGSSMIGFGQYHYRYDSGHEGDTFLVGFAPRKAESVVYLMGYISDQPDYAALLERLGPHRMGKSCLYIRDVEKIDADVLGELVRRSVADLKTRYPDHAI